MDSGERFRVVIRLRPAPIAASGRRRAQDRMLPAMQEETLEALSCRDMRVHRPGQEPLTLRFDRVLAPAATQEQVYDAVHPVVDSVVTRGSNGTILAYGQTGSGKTHTMLGEALVGQGRGVIAYALEYLFHQVQSNSGTDHSCLPGGQHPCQVTTQVYVSFAEVYNEQVFDLLSRQQDAGRAEMIGGAAPSNSRSKLEVREDRDGSISVPGLTIVHVRSLSQALEVLRFGVARRACGDNTVNPSSSRSHAVFTVCIERLNGEAVGTPKVSKLSLVDLAGSEKLHPRATMSSAAVQELTCINRSLSALGKCVAALADPRRVHIPCRDSKLTRLLQDSLKGQSRTAMIVCASVAAAALEESISSLLFAHRARRAIVPARLAQPSTSQQGSQASMQMAELLHYVAQLNCELQQERQERKRLEDVAARAQADLRRVATGRCLPLAVPASWLPHEAYAVQERSQESSLELETDVPLLSSPLWTSSASGSEAGWSPLSEEEPEVRLEPEAQEAQLQKFCRSLSCEFATADHVDEMAMEPPRDGSAHWRGGGG